MQYSFWGYENWYRSKNTESGSITSADTPFDKVSADSLFD